MSDTRVAVVTGSNKGIGFGIVKNLCQNFDGIVYLTSRNEERGRAAVAELRKLGLQPHYHQLDIDDEQSVIKLKDHLKSTHGGLDVLVNNAAIGFRPSAPEPFGLQAHLTLQTNFFNTIRASSILLDVMKPQGRIVNVSSSAGHLSHVNGDEPAATDLRNKLASYDLTTEELYNLVQGFVDAAQTGQHGTLGWPTVRYVPYKVSKIGLSAWTRIMQKKFDEEGRDIIINSVHPGYVETDMTNHEKDPSKLTVDQGAEAASWLALLPRDVREPRGAYVWHDKQLVDWVNGPLPALH